MVERQSKQRVIVLLIVSHILGSLYFYLMDLQVVSIVVTMACISVLAIGISIDQHWWGRRVAIGGTAYIFGVVSAYSMSMLGESNERGLHLFILSNVMYHYGEFLFVNYCHHNTLSWNSFLLNHSLAYTLAVLVTITEYSLGRYLSLKKDSFIVCTAGILFCGLGHFFRLGAFVVAQSNFNHLIQAQRKDGHVLVTHGVYALSRHPSYLGFFLTQIGHQLLLANLLSQFLSLVVTYRFFLLRIEYEEMTLNHFFNGYALYACKTGIGIPFMQYLLDRRRAEREAMWARRQEEYEVLAKEEYEVLAKEEYEVLAKEE